ncbi:MAG: hypothetical protein WCW53_12555 [Syntrophales bacterium]|jgi:hypothetical protein
MNGQAAENLALYDNTTSISRFGNTTGDQVFKSKFYEDIMENLSMVKKHENEIVDTTYPKSNIIDIFPNKIPNPQETRYSFSVLQEWEGYVVSIAKDTFTARLIDITRNCTMEEEEADFPLDDLDDTDRSRISLGAIFRWVVSYRRSPGGTKDRLSRIVFRNLPAWTAKEIEKNRHDAAEWAGQLNVE